MSGQTITRSLLCQLSFSGPYPHGEYRLFDEASATANGECCILTVEPPDEPCNPGRQWLCRWNLERHLWAEHEKKQVVRWKHELLECIALSKDGKPMP